LYFIYKVFDINRIRNNENPKTIIEGLEKIKEDKKDSSTKIKPLKLFAWNEEDTSEALKVEQMEKLLLLQSIGEVNIADIAKAIREDTNIPDDDKWNEFIAQVNARPQLAEWPSKALKNGQIEQLLQSIGEVNIADIAKAIREDTNIPDDDKWNEFIAQVNARPQP
jgi:hypothetical protein